MATWRADRAPKNKRQQLTVTDEITPASEDRHSVPTLELDRFSNTRSAQARSTSTLLPRQLARLHCGTSQPARPQSRASQEARASRAAWDFRSRKHLGNCGFDVNLCRIEKRNPVVVCVPQNQRQLCSGENNGIDVGPGFHAIDDRK